MVTVLQCRFQDSTMKKLEEIMELTGNEKRQQIIASGIHIMSMIKKYEENGWRLCVTKDDQVREIDVLL